MRRKENQGPNLEELKQFNDQGEENEPAKETKNERSGM